MYFLDFVVDVFNPIFELVMKYGLSTVLLFVLIIEFFKSRKGD